MKTIIIMLLIFNFGLASPDDHAHENKSDEHHEEHGEHDKHENEKTGLNKAVIEFNETDGIKLSKNALNMFPIKTYKLQRSHNKYFIIPKSSLNNYLDKYSIFVIKNDFYKQVSIKLIKEINDQYLIDSKEVSDNDIIAASNISILNITHVFLEDDSEYGHGH